ncbi:MAG: hypothetical protein HOE90_22560 [Bacteriovoracaceae bacterium]|jgi:hypothetical protein|nr:hypothetical protein [Bacteriovoracaceae bacterium]
MLSCKELYEHLASGKELTRIQKLQYPMHLFMCHNCKKIASQFKTINSSFKKVVTKRMEKASEDKISELEKSVWEEVERKIS